VHIAREGGIGGQETILAYFRHQPFNGQNQSALICGHSTNIGLLLKNIGLIFMGIQKIGY
jgi:hypothetical protein